MVINGYRLEDSAEPCPYLNGRDSLIENMIISEIDETGLKALLESGFRHFGPYFFRPACKNCRECRSIRIPVDCYRYTRGDRRILKKAESAGFTERESNSADREKYGLYLKHKTRFGNKDKDSYSNWKKSFFSGFPFSRALEIRDGERLVSVIHLDSTVLSVSAVYCYWDPDYASYSPGRLSVLKGILEAGKNGVRHFYLGYYIKDNPHMSYKINYRPNEILSAEGVWKKASD